MPSRPKATLNRFHSSSDGPPGGGTVTRWTCSGGRSWPQRLRMSGISWTPQNQVAIRRLALRVADLVEERAVRDRAAVLDVLLPLRRDLPDQVAHREHQVHLGAGAVAERLQRPADLRAGRGREDLVADDRGAAVAGGPARRARPRRRSPRPPARPTAAASGRARRGSARRSGRRGRGCRPPRACAGCGTARPGGTTCRSSGCRRAGGRARSRALLLQQQAQRERQDSGVRRLRHAGAVDRQQAVRVAVDRVTSPQQGVAQPGRPGVHPVAVLGAARTSGGPRAATSRGSRVWCSSAALAAGTASRPSTCPTRRARSVASADSGAGAGQPADADQPRAPRAGSSTTRTRSGADPVAPTRSAVRSRSTRRGQRAAAGAPASATRASRAAPVGEAAGGPGVGEHRGQVGAEHEDRRAATAGRPAAARPASARIGSASTGSPTSR